MEGTSAEGPAVAHLFLFRRGAMVVGITVAGLTKPTRMAEAEAIAAIVLRKIDPQYRSQTGPRQARQLNTVRPSANATGSGSPGSGAASSAGTGQRVRVYNTGGVGLRLRREPDGPILERFPDGTILEVVGPDKQVAGRTWKNVRRPGDGSGWSAAEYLQPVSATPASGASPAPAASSAPSTTSTASRATPSESASRTAAPAAPAAESTSRSAPAETSGELKVDISPKLAKLKANQEQTVEIRVTRNGAPVADASVNVSTMPTGEKPEASEDRQGREDQGRLERHWAARPRRRWRERARARRQHRPERRLLRDHRQLAPPQPHHDRLQSGSWSRSRSPNPLPPPRSVDLSQPGRGAAC